MVRQLPVKEWIAGSIPAAAASSEGQADGRRQLSRKQSSDEPCEFDSHPFRLKCALGRAALGASLPSWKRGFDSRRALGAKLIGDRLAVGCLTLNQETEVRTLLPELKPNKHSGAVAVGSDAWL